ncbi:MAG: aromatic ring-hydroxylating dioxygenase subunit alpha [Actinomycetota bacterium]
MSSRDLLHPDELSALMRPGSVHRRIYTDPAIFELERTRVFAGGWSYVGHESELPDVGDYIAATVGGRPVIVTRDTDGHIHAVLNRCTHRGAVLTVERRGCAKRFTCPYHGWTFANDGRCVAVPFPRGHPAEDRSGFDLGRLELDSHRGFLFATLADEPESLHAWLGHARPYLDAIVDRQPGGDVLVVPTAIRLEYAGNWKLAWDNAADGLHATFAHRSYNALGASDDVETVLARDPGSTPMVAKALGHGHMVVDQRPGIPAGPWSTMRNTPFREIFEDAVHDRGAADQLDLATGSMVNLSLFPNLIFVGNQLLVVEPLAVDRTRLTMHLMLAPGAAPEIDQLRLRVDEDFVSFGTPDDLEMFERVQEGLAIPEMEWIDVSRGLVDGADESDEDGVVSGPITSEAPQRGYLRRYLEMLTTEVVTRAR